MTAHIVLVEITVNKSYMVMLLVYVLCVWSLLGLSCLLVMGRPLRSIDGGYFYFWWLDDLNFESVMSGRCCTVRVILV